LPIPIYFIEKKESIISMTRSQNYES